MTTPATPVPILPLHIDSTMISAFRSCPQRFYNEFVLGLRPTRRSIDLHAGAVFSKALEHFYSLIWIEGLAPDEAIVRTQEVFMREWGDFVSNKPNSPKTPQSMWDAFLDYVRTYPPFTDHIQPYFTPSGRPTFEYSFALPLGASRPEDPDFPLHPSGQPFIYAGRPDALGHWNGKTIIRDEKTSAKLDSNWAEQWDLRSQFMGYVWAAQQQGLSVDTVAVRGIIITKTMIRQVEAFKVYSRHDISRWFEQLRRDLWRIRRAWDEGYWDYNFADSCTNYGSCMFLPLCKSPSPSNWYSTFEVSRWNPLDRNPIDPSNPSVPSPPSDPSIPPSAGES